MTMLFLKRNQRFNFEQVSLMLRSLGVLESSLVDGEGGARAHFEATRARRRGSGGADSARHTYVMPRMRRAGRYCP